MHSDGVDLAQTGIREPQLSAGQSTDEMRIDDRIPTKHLDATDTGILAYLKL
ncbi:MULTISPECIES: hypothetical protein [Larkinella]|uniref:hypothetical protein n=1 Tax=Larkinella TaxID=332157 RepID=UPI00140204FC|nr:MULTISPECIES: hypothetical protein [Larkinella]